jgi:hypothetical protein
VPAGGAAAGVEATLGDEVSLVAGAEVVAGVVVAGLSAAGDGAAELPELLYAVFALWRSHAASATVATANTTMCATFI